MDLLIVEDDVGIQTMLTWGLKDEFNVLVAGDREEALTLFREKMPKVVTLDLGLPPDPDNASEGLKLLGEILAIAPFTKVIVLTGSEQKEHALKAIELGACDYLTKPLSIENINYSLKRAYQLSQLESENRQKRQEDYGDNTLIGNSVAIKSAIKILSRIAPKPVSTMLLGESGTGKEVFARTMHEQSGRSGEFIAINCASIPESLLESELFGHEKGAFTGAHKNKKGIIERADGGTLFLDEIGDMPIDLQAKLLRFLQEREIERVGGSTSIPVDVRVLCATHRDLKSMSAEKTFREDLYFRLAEFTLKIPSLRERDDDVLLLAKWFLEEYAKEFNVVIRGFSDDALTAIMHHNWPGNIRELQNCIKGGLILNDTGLVTAENLALSVDDNMLSIPAAWLASSNGDDDDDLKNLGDVRKRAESKALFRAYKESEGNISRAAETLGITRPTFYSLAEKYGMRPKQTS
jgi:two-component system, NtrC family, response regulator